MVEKPDLVSSLTIGLFLTLSAFLVLHTQLGSGEFGSARVVLILGFAVLALAVLIKDRITEIGVSGSGLQMKAETQQVEARLESLDRRLERKEEEEEDVRSAAPPPSAEEEGEIEEIQAQVVRIESGGNKLRARAYRQLARQLKRAGKHREAAQAYLSAFDVDPTDPAPLNFAGVITSRDLEDHHGAEQLYRRALAVDPSYVSPLYNMSCNEARRGEDGKALRLLTAAVSADPKYRRLARSDAQTVFGKLADDPRFRELVADSA